jgi:hypothetical protein
LIHQRDLLSADKQQNIAGLRPVSSGVLPNAFNYRRAYPLPGQALIRILRRAEGNFEKMRSSETFYLTDQSVLNRLAA